MYFSNFSHQFIDVEKGLIFHNLAVNFQLKNNRNEQVINILFSEPSILMIMFLNKMIMVYNRYNGTQSFENYFVFREIRDITIIIFSVQDYIPVPWHRINLKGLLRFGN